MGFFSRFRRQPLDLNERSPELGLRYGDLLVLEQLVRAGDDPTAPRHVVYYLYFDERASADAAAGAAEARGFGVEIREPSPEVTDQWAAVCELHDQVLTPDVVRANSDFFEDVATRHGGDYDGWEASVV